MKGKRSMLGFWVTISIAAVFICSALSLAYWNPSASIKGLLATLAIATAWLLVANFIINSLQKNEKNTGQEDDTKDVYSSYEAVNAEDELTSEFNGLVSTVACRNARLAGKLLTHKEADDKNCPEEKLISPEDMEKAFWEAARLVSERCDPVGCSCKTNCDKQTLLQKIQRLRKEYEEKS